jgi:hypothetical protein
MFPNRYVARYDSKSLFVPSDGKINLTHAADRIWVEDESGVRFIKHRFADLLFAQVDAEEFLMIKLKAVPL